MAHILVKRKWGVYVLRKAPRGAKVFRKTQKGNFHPKNKIARYWLFDMLYHFLRGIK